MFSQGKTKQNHKGLRKMSRLFFSVSVIVKSSDWTRSRRKGRTDMGRKGSVLDGLLFMFLFFFWQGNQGTRVLRGEKCKTKPERWDRKTTEQTPKVERWVTRSQVGCWTKEVTECPPALRLLVVKTWLCLVLSLSGF